MKLNVRWGYNNVCIKKGDEWKAGGGTMTSGMLHVIAKLQLYSCFAEVLPKVQAFSYFLIRVLTSPNRT